MKSTGGSYAEGESMADVTPLFTVFTPTYNRSGTLRRPYESLRRQTLRNFEWLVIDDGSTDGTRGVIEAWQQAADFSIRYEWQENAGKAAAWNRALELARSEFFICLDSDDACAPEALASFKELWESIPTAKRDCFSGITVLATDQNGVPYGSNLPVSPIDCSHLAVTYRLKRFHDSWQCYRTDIIRRYPFELIPGYRNYLPETAVINRVAASYLQRHVNQRLLIVHTDEHVDAHGHQSCGLSAKEGLKHAPGIRAANLSLLKYQMSWFLYAPVQFYKKAANYIRFSWMQGISTKAQFAELHSLQALALWVAALPAGIALRLNDRLVKRRAKA
jgi:glycosyltransferase involved in cell wall biosynthesis